MSGTYGIRLKWHTIACFELQFGNTTVLTDPCITISPGTKGTWEDVEHCDIITISHIHWDHITDLPELCRKFYPKLLVGELSAMPLLSWLDYNPTWTYPMTPDLELDFGEVKIRALFGRHVDQYLLRSELCERIGNRPYAQQYPEIVPFQILPGSLEYRNYLFTDKNGTKVLIWGNNPTEEQRNLLKKFRPDIAIMQLTKHEPKEMAQFCKEIGARVVIPHHMDLSKTEAEYMPKVEAFRDAFLSVVPEGAFYAPAHGEWIEL